MLAVGWQLQLLQWPQPTLLQRLGAAVMESPRLFFAWSLLPPRFKISFLCLLSSFFYELCCCCNVSKSSSDIVHLMCTCTHLHLYSLSDLHGNRCHIISSVHSPPLSSIINWYESSCHLAISFLRTYLLLANSCNNIAERVLSINSCMPDSCLNLHFTEPACFFACCCLPLYFAWVAWHHWRSSVYFHNSDALLL